MLERIGRKNKEAVELARALQSTRAEGQAGSLSRRTPDTNRELQLIGAFLREDLDARNLFLGLTALGYSLVEEGPSGARFDGPNGVVMCMVVASHHASNVFNVVFAPRDGSPHVELVREGELVL